MNSNWGTSQDDKSRRQSMMKIELTSNSQEAEHGQKGVNRVHRSRVRRVTRGCTKSSHLKKKGLWRGERPKRRGTLSR